jgi:hypothetical protein
MPSRRSSPTADRIIVVTFLLAMLLPLSSLLRIPTASAAGVIYVQPGGTGAGTSWLDAKDLAPALAASASMVLLFWLRRRFGAMSSQAVVIYICRSPSLIR